MSSRIVPQRYTLYMRKVESRQQGPPQEKKAKPDEVLAAHCRADLQQVTFIFVFRPKMNVYFRFCFVFGHKWNFIFVGNFVYGRKWKMLFGRPLVYILYFGGLGLEKKSWLHPWGLPWQICKLFTDKREDMWSDWIVGDWLTRCDVCDIHLCHTKWHLVN